MSAELGQRLKEQRQRLGISQEYLATLLNREQTAISKMENGARQINVHEFLHWCKALNLSYAEATELLRIAPYDHE